MSFAFEQRNTKRLEALLFLAIFFLEVSLTAYLILAPRMPKGSDGLSLFSQQYYFLNNIVTAGELPFWTPFMTHGAVNNWLYTPTAGLFHGILTLTGFLFKGWNFIPLFHSAMLFDELVLLVGTWLLANRFFRSPFTVFFVAVSVMGTSIWMDSPWFNYRFYYAVPLILHFGHRFLETGKAQYALAAGNLAALQILGQLPYAAPATALVLFLYFFFYGIFNRNEVWGQIRKIKLNLLFWATLAAVLLTLIAVFTAIDTGTKEIMTYSPGRDAEAQVTLDTFMTYSGHSGLQKWLGLLDGISGNDLNLYTGMMAVPFVVLSLLFGMRKKNLHLWAFFLVIFLFSCGTFVTAFFFYTWPLMKLFRHIYTVSVFANLSLCFLAGFGVEAVFYEDTRKESLLGRFLPFKPVCLGLGLFMFAVGAIHFLIAYAPEKHAAWIEFIAADPLDVYGDVTRLLFSRAAVFAGLAGLVLTLIARRGKKLSAGLLITILLLIHTADLSVYKFIENNIRSRSLTKEQYDVTNFQSAPYSGRRTVFFWQNNPRAHILYPNLKVEMGALLQQLQAAKYRNEKAFLTHRLLGHLLTHYGAEFWAINAFFFFDQLGTSFRTDLWLRPFDQFIRACWAEDINDPRITPHAVFYGNYMSPVESLGCRKAAGATEDKIQFFSEAFGINPPEKIGFLIGTKEYTGDVLLLSVDETVTSEDIVPWTDGTSSSVNTRISLPYIVDRFDANNLVLTVNLEEQDAAWVYYSDVWHPFWRADVNGKPAEVYRANLGYKAVRIERGENKVRFRFQPPLLSLIYTLFGVNALVWLGIIASLMAGILRQLGSDHAVDKNRMSNHSIGFD
ncbi:MAG: hypothetical protein Q8R76_10730 [Candidatus Omnitrophota bacterium]|nr:hypothetical protein [Candidatus Omnitrophota bacterium]